MMSRKALLAGALSRSRLLEISRLRWRSQLPALAYHRILDRDLDPRRVADAGLFSATVSEFDRQMRFLAHRFTSITLRDMASSSLLPKHPVLITFDDGYEDNYRLAFPILKRHGLRGVFFVATDFIDGHGPLWFDHVASLLKAPRLPAQLEIDAGTMVATGAGHEATLRHTMKRLKQLPGNERGQVIGNIERQLGGNRGERKPPGKPMTWPQLREMSQAGMEIGSHSRSHTVLANESHDVIRDELAGSRERIEKHIDGPCISLAYPVGGRESINAEVMNVAAKSGYQYACTYLPGSNRIPIENPLALRRQHVELDVSFSLFDAQLALPEIFA